MTRAFSRRLLSLVMSCVMVMILPCILPARAQTVVMTVKGGSITEFDIEQRTRLNFLATRKQPARQDVINQLIDDKRKIKEAKTFGIDPTIADVDGAYAEMGLRMRMTPEQLTKSLEDQNIRLDTLKGRIKAELAGKNLTCLQYKILHLHEGVSDKCRISPIPKIRRVAQMRASDERIALAQR